tara:strand:- start:65 stop:559 length:495 start_codon:yes stop_codon:yes gene_type:complete
MKHLLFLLLIPLLSFSQTYKDVMSIKSENTFKKVVIENGYEFDNDKDDVVWYGWNIAKDSVEGNKSSKWASYNKLTGAFKFQLSRTNPIADFLNYENDTSKNAYDLIVADIKEKCKYYTIINYKGIDHVSYSCSESSYKGKIAFVIDEGWGVIRHFPPYTPTQD